MPASTSPAPGSPATGVHGADPKTGIFRHGFGLKGEVEGAIAGDYQSALVERLRSNDYRLDIGPLSVFLAREFGFCYGVDKAVDFAYQTRQRFPDRRIFLTAEIIHNPRVNRRLLEMGIEFLAGQYATPGATIDSLQPADVVLLPAFGATVEEIARIKARGCTVVDTTCGSVVHVWKRVEKYARDGYASVIHGKYAHEETQATCSRVSEAGGEFVVVFDKNEAQLLCDFIEGRATAAEVMDRLAPHATSPGFDPDRHLARLGCANQTTMLSTESLGIAAMLRDSLARRHGEEGLAGHFRSFDTICSATQERQDAVKAFEGLGLGLILVVGGFNSSNTTHLIEIASEIAPAYHIEDASDIVSAAELSHQPLHARGQRATATGWLPPLPLRLGLTAGASTPNRAIGDVIARVASLLGLDDELGRLLAG